MPGKIQTTVKRNTTPTLPVTVYLPLSQIKKLEFIFKKKCTKNHPALVHKVFTAGQIPVDESETSVSSFRVLLPLTAKETACFQVGEMFMDTRAEMKDGTVPETEIVSFNVTPTLFGDGV